MKREWRIDLPSSQSRNVATKNNLVQLFLDSRACCPSVVGSGLVELLRHSKLARRPTHSQICMSNNQKLDLLEIFFESVRMENYDDPLEIFVFGRVAGTDRSGGNAALVVDLFEIPALGENWV